MKLYVFLYFMKNDVEKIRQITPNHIRYWKENKPTRYSGGPFGDRSGGLIIFEARDMDVAEALALNDPFVIEQLIEIKWIKEWMQAQ